MAFIIDTSTGTILTAETCYLVPDEYFTDVEWDDVENLSNSEICRIGRENGLKVEITERLVQAVADALWGEGADTEWSPDTPEVIADAIQNLRPDLYASRN